MNKFLILLLLGITLSYGFTLPESKKKCANTVIEKLIACRFKKAFAQIDSMSNHAPDDPLGPFLHMYGIGLQDLDLDRRTDSAGFLQSYNKTLKLISEMEQKKDTTSYSKTLRGFTKATYSAYCLRNKEYGAGVHVGLEAIRDLKEAKEMDPDNSDADLYLGLYDYAKGELRKQLWWVLFWFPGSKEEGIKQLENASDNSQISSLGADLVLVDIYITEKMYGKSWKLIRSLETNYPTSRYILWSKAKYFHMQEQYSKAAQVYRRLCELYSSIPNAGRSVLSGKSKQAHMLFLDKKYDESMQVCREILKEADSWDDPRVQEIRKDAEKLIRDIKKNDKS
ncbi:MAG: hypothetical protein GF401_01475 [Chitinivibrionales bacterium]|nr:hypothetical protein [Chitinivibrionales bacterium]